MKHLAIILLCLACCVFAQAPANRVVTKNIRYRAEEEYVNDYIKERCVLDINAPENAKDCTVVVWYHGGGLTGGSKSVPAPFFERNKKQPIIVCGMGYRLAKKNGCKVVDCLQDAAAGLAWVMKNIQNYGGDPQKVFVSGHSAGGYLTLMLGMDPRWLAPYGITPSQIKGLIPESGQCLSHFTYRAEKGMKKTEPLVDDMAPIFHAKNAAQIPPVLLLTGDREMEMLGRYEENALLRRMLLINGHTDVTLYEFQGYGHGMTQPAVDPLIRFVNRVTGK